MHSLKNGNTVSANEPVPETYIPLSSTPICATSIYICVCVVYAVNNSVPLVMGLWRVDYSDQMSGLLGKVNYLFDVSRLSQIHGNV